MPYSICARHKARRRSDKQHHCCLTACFHHSVQQPMSERLSTLGLGVCTLFGTSPEHARMENTTVCQQLCLGRIVRRHIPGLLSCHVSGTPACDTTDNSWVAVITSEASQQGVPRRNHENKSLYRKPDWSECWYLDLGGLRVRKGTKVEAAHYSFWRNAGIPVSRLWAGDSQELGSIQRNGDVCMMGSI